MQGEIDSKKIIEEMKKVLKDIEIEYIEIVNHSFDRIDKIEKGNSIILVAAKVANVRLIDNIWI